MKRNLLLKLFGGLFMELKDDDQDGVYTWMVSKGSVMLLLVFAHMAWVWTHGRDIADGELNAFYALLGYAGAKIGREIAEVIRGVPGGEKNVGQD